MPKKEEKGAGATSGGAGWRKLKPIIVTSLFNRSIKRSYHTMPYVAIITMYVIGKWIG
jgi:hypothetical protein